MKKNISYKVISIAFSVLTVCFLMVFYSLAWTDPSANPPNNNVSTPLNISSTGQTKSGGLILNTAGAENGLIVRYGNVGIGTLSPQSPLTVSGEVHLGVMSSFQQEGKVIIGRSGATLRNHEIKAFNSSTASQNYLTFGIHNGMYDGVTNYVTDALTIRGDGRVGIGTASPSQALDVQGNIVASGSICANGGSDCIGGTTRILLDLPTVLYRRGSYSPSYASSNVGSETGTIIAGTTSGVPSETTEILLYGSIDDADGRDRIFEYKYPSHTYWKRLVSSPANAFYPNNNSVWVPFGPEGRIQWRLVMSDGTPTTPSTPQEYILEIQGVNY